MEKNAAPKPRWEDRLRRESRLDIDDWALLVEARVLPAGAPPILPCLRRKEAPPVPAPHQPART